MLLQAVRTVFAPHTIAFLCKLSAIIAIVAFATGGFTTGLMLNVYIYAARAWVPERSYYERPLFFEYNNTAAMASVTFIKWHKTPDGYSVSPERVEFLKSREQVNIKLQLTLPETSENEGLFQLHSFLKSDSDAVLHTLQRPLSLPHRSPIVRTMRQVVLFPFFLVGVLTESETVRFPLAQTFTEHSHSPLAAVDILLTGARPQDPPPRVSHGVLTVNVRMNWFQWAFAFFRLSPLLNVAMLITATALMLLSSAAAMCSCVLCMQVVANFWQESGSSSQTSEHGGSSLPTASPLSQPDGAGMDASGSYMGFRSQRNVDRDAMHARAPHTSVYTTLGSGGERVRHGSWDGSEGEGGEDRDLRDSLSTIAEERAGSETSQGAQRDGSQRDSICESDAQFRHRVKAAVQRGKADYNSRLAAPEGSGSTRGFLGAWGSSGGAGSTPKGGVLSGGVRAREGKRKGHACSDARTSSGASGSGIGAERIFEAERCREELQDEPEGEIQPAGEKHE